MEIISLIKNSDNLYFEGILTHAGNTYTAADQNEIIQVHNQSVQLLIDLKKRILVEYPNCILSIGDTPGCNLATDFNGVDEIRPGNFVFCDVMQYFLGSCSFEQIAIAVACPVVAKHKSRNEIVIYGGAIHLSKEVIYDKKNQKTFGLIVKLKNGKWEKPIPETYVSNLSQEHGIIKTTSEVFDQIKIGETIGVIPVHSCLTANLLSQYTTTNNKIIKKFRFNS
jgi:D-serine deaminase-like pyridoxal phosphate-dependent protein